MRITYVQAFSRLSRKACQEQAVGTAAALARAGAEMTLLLPQGPGDPALCPEAIGAFHRVEGRLRIVQRPFLWPDTGVGPSYFWLKQALADPTAGAAELMMTRIPAVLGAGIPAPRPLVFDHYRPWPDHLPWLKRRFRQVVADEGFAGVVTHSHYAAASYRRLPVPEEKLLVAHNGFDPAGMQPSLSKQAARRMLELPQDRPIVVYAGRLNLRKGLDRVTAMAAQAPEALFLLVGAEGDGAVRRAVADAANIRLAPWQTPETLAPWLYAADVLLIPPSLDPLRRFKSTVLPLKLFRYLAAGRPILAPHSPDTAELLRDGHNALLVAADDPAAAVAALRRLLASPGLCERLGHNALDLAGERTWDHRAQRLLGFFERRLMAAAQAQRAAA